MTDTAEIPESQAVNVRNRSYVVAAQVDLPGPGAQGVLFAHGSRFGGHALYVKDNRLHCAYNFVGIVKQKIDATEDLPVGEGRIKTQPAGFTIAGEGLCVERRALHGPGARGRRPDHARVVRQQSQR